MSLSPARARDRAYLYQSTNAILQRLLLGFICPSVPGRWSWHCYRPRGHRWLTAAATELRQKPGTEFAGTLGCVKQLMCSLDAGDAAPGLSLRENVPFASTLTSHSRAHRVILTNVNCPCSSTTGCFDDSLPHDVL